MIDLYLCSNDNEVPKLIFSDSINSENHTKFKHSKFIGRYQLNDIIAIPVYKCIRNKNKLLPNNNKNLILQITYIDTYNKKFVGRDMFNGFIYTFSPIDIISKSKEYWFFDSKGNIQIDYLFRYPYRDKFRIVMNNFFSSYREAHKYRKSKLNEA